jgi:hypothetical protein
VFHWKERQSDVLPSSIDLVKAVLFKRTRFEGKSTGFGPWPFPSALPVRIWIDESRKRNRDIGPPRGATSFPEE